jgi:hypothetical protein
MNGIPRRKLAGFIHRYGTGLIADPTRCEGLLRDTCGEYQREIFVLVHTQRQRVPADLIVSQGRIALGMILPRLIRRMQENCAFEEQAARWGVESWAMALGIIPVEEGSSDNGIPDHSAPAPRTPPPLRPAATAPVDRSAVAHALSSPDLPVRLNALRELRNPHDREETGLLLRALGSDRWQVRFAAFEALTVRGEPARDPLIIALDDGREWLAWRAALVLGVLRDPVAVPPLLRVVRNSPDRVMLRKGAIWALGEIGDRRAVDDLLLLLGDGNGMIRRDAEEAIKKVGSQP